MTISKTSNQQQEPKPIVCHPLAEVAGKFGGQLWLETLEEVECSRRAEKAEINQLLKHTPNE